MTQNYLNKWYTLVKPYLSKQEFGSEIVLYRQILNWTRKIVSLKLGVVVQITHKSLYNTTQYKSFGHNRNQRWTLQLLFFVVVTHKMVIFLCVLHFFFECNIDI